MNSHKNARLTYQARRILVHRIIHEGLPVREAAKAQGVSPKTAYKWLRRYREEGEAGLLDRSQGQGEAPGAPLKRSGNKSFDSAGSAGPTTSSPSGLESPRARWPAFLKSRG